MSNITVDITNVTLQTERLILRAWREKDVKDLFAYASCEDVGPMAGWTPHKTIDESKDILKFFMEGKHTFAIEKDGKVIGSIGIEKYDEAQFPDFSEQKGAEIGFVLSKAYWGQGIMPEATWKVIEWLFDEKKVDFVMCGHFLWNAQSAAVQSKLGFHYLSKVLYLTQSGKQETTIQNIMTAKDYRLQRQIRFITKIDEEKNILRQTHLTHLGRRENDAEHAWHMAIMCYLLQEYANEDIDLAKTMMMCLIHDIVEIEAGDTYAYDEEGKKTQQMREAIAAEHLYAILPSDQMSELKGLFEEFEANQTAEAKFAHAMDNFQPLLLNHANGGSDWRQHDVTRTIVETRQSKTAEGSKKLYEEVERILDAHVRNGQLEP